MLIKAAVARTMPPENTKKRNTKQFFNSLLNSGHLFVPIEF
jgi:hypothetical protein